MGLWGAYHKDSKYLCSSFAVKAGGGLHSKGAYFRVSTVYIYISNKILNGPFCPGDVKRIKLYLFRSK